MTIQVPFSTAQEAPSLRVTQWFNTESPVTLESLRGRVVVLHAFQMLCPGCVSHGLPQAQRIRDTFDTTDVSVIGLHTVFEHHDAMTPTSLAAFVYEYRIAFPVGVDEASPNGGTPQTMAAYGMRGTPSLVLIGRDGAIRRHFFGQPSDLLVGAAVADLIRDSAPNGRGSEPRCDDTACRIPEGVNAP